MALPTHPTLLLILTVIISDILHTLYRYENTCCFSSLTGMDFSLRQNTLLWTWQMLGVHSLCWMLNEWTLLSALTSDDSPMILEFCLHTQRQDITSSFFSETVYKLGKLESAGLWPKWTRVVNSASLRNSPLSYSSFGIHCALAGKNSKREHN